MSDAGTQSGLQPSDSECPPFRYHAWKDGVCCNCGAKEGPPANAPTVRHIPLDAPHGAATEYVEDIMTALHAGLFVYGGMTELQRDAVRGALASAFNTGWREGGRNMADALGVKHAS